MSRNELKVDQAATYEAIVRMMSSGRTESKAFRKLVERLEWVNVELAKLGEGA